jgi:flagellar biosynthesis anti-sigma factor FlgM
MIDRVNISNQGVDRSQSTPGSELVRNAKDRQVSSGSGSDSVALSSKAKQMEQLSATVEESRTERFNKVQQALASGTYHVSARDIAHKLIDANKK